MAKIKGICVCTQTKYIYNGDVDKQDFICLVDGAQGSPAFAYRTQHHEQDEYVKYFVGKNGSGTNSEIFNDYSDSSANGNYSHAEGLNTTASGNYSHSEGCDTTASNTYSHAEGYGTTASGAYSHAEGEETTASGNYSHAEGNSCMANGNGSHAEGYNTIAYGADSHVEGYNSQTVTSSTITSNTLTIGDTASTGYHSHAEGNACMAKGNSSHAEGIKTFASGVASHAEGSGTTASGNYSHAEGYMTLANGSYSHAEGYSTTASSSYSHAEGYRTTANGNYSHAEGYNTKATGIYSHAQGSGTTAFTAYSFCGGKNSFASGGTSFVFGEGLSGNTANQTILGKYNATGHTFSGTAYPTGSGSTYIFVFGWGTSSIKKTIYKCNTSGTWSNDSDERLKFNIKDIDNNIVDAISITKLRQFKFRNIDGTENQKSNYNYGIIAQEVIDDLKKKGINYNNISLITGNDEYGYHANYNEIIILKCKCIEDNINDIYKDMTSISDKVEELDKIIKNLF